jgi:arylsulfatase A-like enzyme
MGGMAYPSRRQVMAGAAAGLAGVALAAEAKPRPNILFLVSDDQRFDTIAALGNPTIRTPNLDGLVKDGFTFTHARIMGSMDGAVCMPSRAMILTGRQLFRAPPNLPNDVALWPEQFRNAGYTTFQTGKWHNGQPSHRRCFSDGDNVFFGGMAGHTKLDLRAHKPAEKYPKKPNADPGYSSAVFADAAIEFLTKPQDKPFVLWCSFTAPHDPRVAPPGFENAYDPAKMPLPKNFLPEHPFDNGELNIRDEKLLPTPRDPEKVKRELATYYAMIEHMDRQVGRILAALRASPHADNTIVVFVGDNGLALGSHGLLGKQSLYDHSIRVPMILAGPGIPKGARGDALVYALDLAPTVHDLCGVTPAPGMNGTSLVPILRGDAKEVRDAAFFAYKREQRAVIEGRYKLIRYRVGGRERVQLFDLASDPDEVTDLSHKPERAEDVTRLTRRLASLQADLSDPAAGK